MKRRGNRRYYQHHEVLLIRKIRELLYDQGFTISGARNQLMDGRQSPPAVSLAAGLDGAEEVGLSLDTPDALRAELQAVLGILKGSTQL